MRIASCALLAASALAASCAVSSEPTASTRDIYLIEGTVFWGPSGKDPVDRAFVRIIDSSSSMRCIVTGCDGRFSLLRADAPALSRPLRIGVERAVEPELRTPTPLVSRPLRAPIRDALPFAIHLYDSEEEAAASRLAPTGSCAPHAVPHLVECPEDRL